MELDYKGKTVRDKIFRNNADALKILALRNENSNNIQLFKMIGYL